LLGKQDKLREISEVSDIIRSISGLQRGKNHLYYPHHKLAEVISKLPSKIASIFPISPD
jgi:hypothetical protein